MTITYSSELARVGADGQVFSATEAYVRWLLEELDAGTWNSDPTQPCLLYKVYQNVQRIPLTSRFPLRLGNSQEALKGGRSAAIAQANPIERLAWLLHYAHGLTRFIRAAPGSLPSIPVVETQPTLPRHLAGPADDAHPFLGRPVPSGGSLHPVEIYLAVGSQWSIPSGIYHYDSVHHALDILRSGDFLTELLACLPEDEDLHLCTALVLPAVFFQKNYQKYTEMSYRLQSLDSGVVIEQLRFLASYFNLHLACDRQAGSTQQQEHGLYLHFLDYPLHQLVGLDIAEECIYAAIPLYTAGTTTVQRCESEQSVPPAVTGRHIQAFPPLARNPLFEAIHTASLEQTFSQLAVNCVAFEDLAPEHGEIALPPAPMGYSGDLSQVLLQRRSGFCSIDTSSLEPVDLAALLTSLHDLSLGAIWQACACQLYCVISRVNGIPLGTYRYNPARHTLSFIHDDEVFPILTRISTAPNVRPEMVPVNLFLCADYQHASAHCGERGFRIMGIELGRALQRLTLAATAHQLASHIHLSYVMRGTATRLLHLPSASQIVLASMMVGHERRSQSGLLEAIWY